MSHVFSGAEVRKAREAAKLSAAAVAAAVGLNRTYYGLYEAGRFVLSDSQQSTIAAFFNKHLVEAPAVKLIKAKEESASTPQSGKSETPDKRIPIPDLKKNEKGLSPPKLSKFQIAARQLSNLDQIVAVDKITGRHTAESAQCLLTSLRMLAYSELFKLTEQRGISTGGIASPPEYGLLKADDQHKKVEQLERVIVCHALYGKRWLECDRRALYKIIRELRKHFPGEGPLVPFPSILDRLVESASEAAETTSRLRIEMAEYLLRCDASQVVDSVSN